MVTLKVDGTVIKQKGSYQAVADSVNYFVLDFVFSEEWQECDSIVVSTTSRADENVSYNQMLEGNSCRVPSKMMTHPGFTLGLVGYDVDGNVKITTQPYEIAVKKTGFNKDAAEPDTEQMSAFDTAINEWSKARKAMKYIHIKWADDEPTADSDMKDAPSDWLGIYCDNENQEPPTDYTAYKWYKVKGEKGDQGEAFTYADFTSEQLAELAVDKANKDLSNVEANGKTLNWDGGGKFSGTVIAKGLRETDIVDTDSIITNNSEIVWDEGSGITFGNVLNSGDIIVNNINWGNNIVAGYLNAAGNGRCLGDAKSVVYDEASDTTTIVMRNSIQGITVGTYIIIDTAIETSIFYILQVAGVDYGSRAIIVPGQLDESIDVTSSYATFYFLYNKSTGSSNSLIMGDQNSCIGKNILVVGSNNKRIVSNMNVGGIIVSGDNNKFAGSYSLIVGTNNNGGTGCGNIVAGYQNVISSGSRTCVTGVGNIANGSTQFVCGKYNVELSSGNTDLFIVGNGTSLNNRCNAFRVTAEGNVYGMADFSASGADYAEYFEWIDGNPDNEDRRGLFVTLDGEKIRKATADDEYILGIVSAFPAIKGDSQSEIWKDMYLTDVFGEKLTEEVEVEEYTDKDTGEVIPAHTETRWILNPDYDTEQEYVRRENRQEWSPIGLVGKLVVVDDGTCEVNGYCKPGANGKGTKSETVTRYRVMSRLDDTHIKVFIQ